MQVTRRYYKKMFAFQHGFVIVLNPRASELKTDDIEIVTGVFFSSSQKETPREPLTCNALRDIHVCFAQKTHSHCGV